MKRLLQGAEVWRDGGFVRADVLVDGDRIAAVGLGLPVEGCEVVPLGGMKILPGLVDVHVHLREPGFTAKETIATGTRAAAHGGYTTVCPMPNLSPAPDSPEHLAVELEAIRRDAAVRVVPYGCITRGQKGRGELVDFDALAPDVVGFSDDGRGVQEEALMREAMRRVARTGRPVVAHCEVEALLDKGYIHDGGYCRAHGHRGISSESEWRQVERDIRLVAETGCRYHVCHVSTKESVELVRRAKAAGLPVSCETAPHYLVLCDEDLREEGRFKMNPPLRSRADREALVAGLQDGTIEVIATDHAPHTAAEKARGLAGSAMGVVGLECAFAVLNTALVGRGIISFARLVEAMAVAPRRIFSLGGGTIAAGEPADLTAVDTERAGTVDPDRFLSMGRSTPFAGMAVRGEVMLTLVGGREAYRNGDLKRYHNTMNMKPYTKKIVLENGQEFYGYGFGADKEAICEIVFNTSMVGYQEIMSDPSYTDQMVVMTYPLIGNYGMTDEDYETKNPTIGGMIVREYNDSPSNFRYTKTLSEVFEEHAIPGIEGVDTRMLTRIIRNEGSQRVMITSVETPREEALARMAATPWPHDMVSRVSCRKRWMSRVPNHKYDVVAVDCGIKYNIIRLLNRVGCNVTVVPYDATAEQILAFRPDGLVLSNGPGDPNDVQGVIELVRQLRGRLPIFGICMGHQLISLAYGAKTFKMKFGHRGANHPVKTLQTGKIEITSRNHSFAVDVASLEGTGLELTHVNLLDGTAEGVACYKDGVFSMQYHPESASGPQDSAYLFDKFTKMMEDWKNA